MVEWGEGREGSPVFPNLVKFQRQTRTHTPENRILSMFNLHLGEVKDCYEPAFCTNVYFLSPPGHDSTIPTLMWKPTHPPQATILEAQHGTTILCSHLTQCFTQTSVGSMMWHNRVEIENAQIRMRRLERHTLSSRLGAVAIQAQRSLESTKCTVCIQVFALEAIKLALEANNVYATLL
jgi:hypothetical protein